MLHVWISFAIWRIKEVYTVLAISCIFRLHRGYRDIVHCLLEKNKFIFSWLGIIHLIPLLSTVLFTLVFVTWSKRVCTQWVVYWPVNAIFYWSGCCFVIRIFVGPLSPRCSFMTEMIAEIVVSAAVNVGETVPTLRLCHHSLSVLNYLSKEWRLLIPVMASWAPFSLSFS